MAPVSAPQHHMPHGFPWGMHPHFVAEGYQFIVEVPMAQPFIYVPPSVVHVAPYVERHIFHVDQSEIVGIYERIDDFQDHF